MALLQGERRRDSRWDVRDGVQCRLDLRTRVRLIDISATGALLAGDVAVPVGTHGHLRSAMGPAPFASDVEVRRVGTASARPALAIGAIFVEMNDRSRRSLEQFLKRASE